MAMAMSTVMKDDAREDLRNTSDSDPETKNENKDYSNSALANLRKRAKNKTQERERQCKDAISLCGDRATEKPAAEPVCLPV